MNGQTSIMQRLLGACLALAAITPLAAPALVQAAHSWGSAITLTEAERQFLEGGTTFNLCVLPDYPPLQWIDNQGRHEGVIADLLASVADKAGIGLTMVPSRSHGESKALFSAGRCDLITHVVAGGRAIPDAKTTMGFLAAELGYTIPVTQRDGGAEASLPGRRVGVLADIDYSGLQALYPTAELVEVDSIHSGMEAVVAGELHTMVAPLLALNDGAGDSSAGYLKVGGALGIHQEFALQVTARRGALLPILNKAIAAVDTDERQAIIHRRLYQGQEGHLDGFYIFALVVVLLGLVVVLSRYRYLWRRSQQLQSTLTDSEARFQRLADNAPDMFFRMTLPGGRYEYVSPSSTAIFGYTPGEFLATPNLVAKVTHSDWETYVNERWLSAQSGDIPSSSEFQVVHKWGELRWVNQRCSVIRDGTGRPIAIEGIISDVTARRQSDAALQESERRYRALLDSSPDWVWEVDANAVYTYVSPKVHDLLGYRPDEVIGKTPFDFMAPGEPERIGAAFAEIVASKRPFHNLENTNRHKDGSLVVLETSGTPILSETGELLGFRGVDRNITQRIQNESELRTQRDFTNTILECAGNVIVVLDLEGRFVSFNRAAEELTGYRREEVLGKEYWRVVLPDEQWDGVMALFQGLKRGDLSIGSQYENEWLTRDRGRRLLQWHNSALRDGEGVISHIVALGYDITERKQMETSLRQQEQELVQIIDHLPSMIFLKEAQGLRYVRINSVYEQLTGIRREEIVGRDDHEFFPREQADFFNERDREVLASGRLEDIPEEPITTPGGTRILHTRKVAINDEHGRPKYLLGISDDITERKEAEREQARLQRELQQAQKMESLGQLTGGIAHDFNNLLGIITGYTGLALVSAEAQGDGKLVGYMQRLQSAGERATNLVAQMLAFSRSDQADDMPIDFAPLVKEDVKMLRSTLPTTIEMQTEVTAGLPRVLMNPTQLHQILMNLAINARDAMQGVGRLTVRLGYARGMNAISPVSHKPVRGDWVELSVSDTGSGIDAETAKKIFNPFFTTKIVGKGTGLGLAVVYGIMEKHKGHILLESEVGKGSTFRMLFPPLGEAELDAGNEGDGAVVVPKGEGEQILVVDDEPSLGHFMAELLNGHGYQATSFSDSLEALECFRHEPERFALVVTDQTMPGLIGMDLIERVREVRPDMPVILCTGYSDKVDAQSAAELGVPFFSKPVDEGQLMRKVAELIGGSRKV